VTGNHEYYSGVHAWIAELRRLGLRVLVNEHVSLRHDGARIVVAGVTDYSAAASSPVMRSDPHRALAARPTTRARAAGAPAALGARGRAGRRRPAALGHTHGGQFLPWNYVVRFYQPFTAGSSPRQAVGLREPRHRLLGTAQAHRGAGRDHRLRLVPA
jgi:hypothetical protein